MYIGVCRGGLPRAKWLSKGAFAGAHTSWSTGATRIGLVHCSHYLLDTARSSTAPITQCLSTRILHRLLHTQCLHTRKLKQLMCPLLRHQRPHPRPRSKPAFGGQRVLTRSWTMKSCRSTLWSVVNTALVASSTSLQSTLSKCTKCRNLVSPPF